VGKVSDGDRRVRIIWLGTGKERDKWGKDSWDTAGGSGIGRSGTGEPERAGLGTDGSVTGGGGSGTGGSGTGSQGQVGLVPVVSGPGGGKDRRGKKSSSGTAGPGKVGRNR
jgi:hypothetical protein